MSITAEKQSRQVTIAMSYGEKPAPLAALLLECQQQMRHFFDTRFKHYDLPQIHATLISLERTTEAGWINPHYCRRYVRSATMDFDGILNYLRSGAEGLLPLRIQVGGFQDRDYPLSSQGRRPYERSFLIDKDKVVMMGWPIRLAGEGHSDSLDTIRTHFERFNVVHKYYRKPGDVDNDFYFRIGLLDASLVSAEEKRQAETMIRETLASMQPLEITIGLCDLSFVGFTEETLSPDGSTSISVCDSRLSSALLHELYKP